MTFRFRIGSLTISDGTEISPPVDGVTVFVGPNNAGKSVALRDIVGTLASPIEGLVVSGVSLDRAGAPDDADAWLSATYPTTPGNGQVQYAFGEHTARQADLPSELLEGPPLSSRALAFLITTLDASSRTSLALSTNSFAVRKEPPRTPLQRLSRSVALETELSTACKAAFGFGVAVDRLGGSEMGLFLGDPLHQIDDIAAYEAEMASRPALDAQGDGVRSYVGILLSALASPTPLLMIDEPEAFLHPPQARLLGRFLAAAAARGRQIFVATHSDDFLRGLLDADQDNVLVVRIQRSGLVNPARVLDPDNLRTLWGDSLLRYSQVLSGVFHQGVVVCEADSDCRFYEAALDRLAASGVAIPDILFVHTGGKDRIPVATRALRSIGVPVAVIADLDVLRSKRLMNTLSDELGVAWADVEASWNVVDSGVRGIATSNPTGYAKAKIDEAFEAHDDAEVTADLKKTLQSALKGSDGWSQIKAGGVAAFPPGDCTVRATALISRFNHAGLFPVPVGELECWAKSVPGHGPDWVADAIESGEHESPSSGIRTFVQGVASFLASAPLPEPAAQADYAGEVPEVIAT